MKNYILIALLIMLFSPNLYSQNKASKLTSYSSNNINSSIAVLQVCDSGALVKVNFETKGYNENTLGLFKDELSMFEEKVFNVQIEDSGEKFQFHYNEKMLIEDLIILFDKYGVKYVKAEELKILNQ